MSTVSAKVDQGMKESSVLLNSTKISSLKMLFFAAIPNSWREKLNESSCKCLRRGKNYRLFEKGIKSFEDEIDIVKLIRELRWLKMAVKELMDEIPERSDRIGRKTEYSKKQTLRLTDEFKDFDPLKMSKVPNPLKMSKVP